MSWLERCYQTYEYIRRAEPDLIGRQEPNRATLLPVGHTTQQAQIQVELDLDGNFLNAFVLRKRTKRRGPKRRMNKPLSSPAPKNPLLVPQTLRHIPWQISFNTLLPTIKTSVVLKGPAGTRIMPNLFNGVIHLFRIHWSVLF